MVYKPLSEMFAILQSYDAEAAIQDHVNTKSAPLCSLGEWPKVGEHGRWQRCFMQDNKLEWLWDNNIKPDNPHLFFGSFTLPTDKDPVQMFHYCRVDLRTSMKGVFEIKHLQDLHTTCGNCLLGIHANVYGPSVVYDLRKHLIAEENSVFDDIKEYEKGDGFFDRRYDFFDCKWKGTEFLELSLSRTFPKGSLYEKGKQGEDNSWKLAIHVHYATRDHEQVATAVGRGPASLWRTVFA